MGRRYERRLEAKVGDLQAKNERLKELVERKNKEVGKLKEELASHRQGLEDRWGKP